MSDLSEESLKNLGRLCRIDIEEEDLSTLLSDLKRVLDYVAELQQIDVNHLSPHSHIEEQGIDCLREDRVGKQLERAVFLANAPDQVGGMIRVPPVMKQAP